MSYRKSDIVSNETQGCNVILLEMVLVIDLPYLVLVCLKSSCESKDYYYMMVLLVFFHLDELLSHNLFDCLFDSCFLACPMTVRVLPCFEE